jgi:long-chain fatty acid transport protein
MGVVRRLCAMGLVVVLGAAPVFAAGFELDEQDVELMGAAFAGRAALSHNASVAWWNPASMSGLEKGWNYNVGAHFLFLETFFSDEGSTDATGAAMLGVPGVDAGENGIIPNLYLTRSIGEKWVAGLAVNAPFGLSTDYPPNSTVRYFATLSELLVLNVEPVVSYRITDQWSVGGGLNVEYADATLANLIDFGSIGAGLGISGLTPQMNDGGVDITGESWAVGWTLGVHCQLDERHRLGLAYRSRVVHHIDGTADLTVPAAAQPIVAASGGFVNTGAKTRLTLPDKLILSGAHQVTAQWTVLWDVSWTDWRRLDLINVTFDNPNQPTSTLNLQWKDTWRFSVGGQWVATDRWTFRTGVAWDQSPVPGWTRGPRLPGADRFWVSIGASYRISDAAHLHVGYFHVFVDQVGINQSMPTSGNLLGSVTGHTDAVSIGITGNF